MKYSTLTALLLIFASFSALAEQRWFEVELLLFQRNAEIKAFSEQLASKEIFVDTSNSISVLKSNKSTPCIEDTNCLSKQNPVVITQSEFDFSGNTFKHLGSSHLELVAQRERLEKHAGFEPLLHMAWRMPVESGRSAKPIHIFAGENFATKIENNPIQLTADNKATDQSIVNSTLSNEIDTERLIENIWAIDGNFKVYLDHYLYIDSQLVIRKAIIEEVSQTEQSIEMIDDENGIQIAKVKTAADETNQDDITNMITSKMVIKEVLFDQNRRLRSEEIHYLDHPLMGIIVQIRKISEEEL